MNWGIIGTGNIAAKFAATVKKMAEEGEYLEAVASRTIDSARQFAEQYQTPNVFGSYESMAASDCIDAVYIATPNHLHYENAKMCLLAGKHVLCEKPFTTNAAQAEALYQLAEEKNLFIMEAFWIRFLPVLERMRHIIREGQLGEIKYARSDYGFITQKERRKRKFASDLGGGALLDIGIYNLGFMNMVMGSMPEGFESDVHMNEFGTDDFSVIHLHYPQGTEAVVTTAIGLAIQRNAAVIGTKGAIYLKDFQKAESMTVCLNNGEEYDIMIPFDINGFEYQIREVSNCVKNHQCHSKIYTPEMSLQTLNLMDDIRASWDMKFSFEE